MANKQQIPLAIQHTTNRERTEWEDPKPTVVPGLTMSIGAMLARQKAGIPNN